MRYSPQRGFTLLVAVILTSVVLAVGLSLASLAYKDVILASFAKNSTYAFYAADAALECALYADQRQDTFDYATYNSSAPPSFSCGGGSATPTNLCYNSAACVNTLVLQERVSLDNNTHCADVTVYKSISSTYLFSQGYSVACGAVGSDPRAVSRGIVSHD